MKKGQRIRILKTGELGTIADQVIMNKGGRRRVYCQVRLDDHPQLDRWYYADQLGDTVERCTVTFRNDRNQELIFDCRHDYEKERLSVTMTGRRPENPNEHFGTHDMLAELMFNGLKLIDEP